MTERRRFPPPWSIEERQESFIVKDANGQQLDRPRAANIGKLPATLRRFQPKRDCGHRTPNPVPGMVRWWYDRERRLLALFIGA